MAQHFSPVVEELINRQMASGKYSSQDDLLREALEALSAEDAEFRAIEEALNDIEHGDEGVPLDEAFTSLRAKHGLTTNG